MIFSMLSTVCAATWATYRYAFALPTAGTR